MGRLGMMVKKNSPDKKRLSSQEREQQIARGAVEFFAEVGFSR